MKPDRLYIMIMNMIKVLGKGRACVPEGLKYV